MKHFFGHKTPSGADILLMESGSPKAAGRALEAIRKIFPDASYHLCTCQPDPPPAGYSSVFRVTDYPTAWQKLGLLFTFRSKGWDTLAILCTKEPILFRWKILAVWLLPAKVLVVNENADYFWLDWQHRKALRLLWATRSGVNLEGAFQALLRALVFPLTFLFLLLTAGFLYARRAWRLLVWKVRGFPPQHAGVFEESGTQTQNPERPGQSATCGGSPGAEGR